MSSANVTVFYCLDMLNQVIWRNWFGSTTDSSHCPSLPVLRVATRYGHTDISGRHPTVTGPYTTVAVTIWLRGAVFSVQVRDILVLKWRHRSDSLRISSICLTFGGVMHTTMKQIIMLNGHTRSFWGFYWALHFMWGGRRCCHSLNVLFIYWRQRITRELSATERRRYISYFHLIV